MSRRPDWKNQLSSRGKHSSDSKPSSFRIKAGALLSASRADDLCMEQLQSVLQTRGGGGELQASATVLPRVWDMRKEIPTPVMDQKYQPICVAQALCYMKQQHEFRENGFRKVLSPHSVYNRRSNYRENQGMTVRDGMEILRDFGCNTVEEYDSRAVWPQEFSVKVSETAQIPRRMEECDLDPNSSEYQIMQSWCETANSNKIRSFARIHTLSSLKTALVENGVCVVIVYVYNDTMEFYKPRRSRSSRMASESLGAHCIAVVGYEDANDKHKGRFILRNSWGSAWGDKGDFYVPYTDFDCFLEIWSAVDGKFLSRVQAKHSQIAATISPALTIRDVLSPSAPSVPKSTDQEEEKNSEPLPPLSPEEQEVVLLLKNQLEKMKEHLQHPNLQLIATRLLTVLSPPVYKTVVVSPSPSSSSSSSSSLFEGNIRSSNSPSPSLTSSSDLASSTNNFGYLEQSCVDH